MSLRYSVRDCLVALLRMKGKPENEVQATADARLDEAVARAQPLISNLNSVNEWEAVAEDLRTWLS